MVDLSSWKRKKPIPQASPAGPVGRLFDLPFRSTFDPFNDGQWWPRVDVSENRYHITVEAEIPGMNKEDIDLSIEDQNLCIRGRKTREEEDERDGYYRVERAYGFFSRIISLPSPVDTRTIDARYKRGVLKIKLKKLGGTQEKRIRVGGKG